MLRKWIARWTGKRTGKWIGSAGPLLCVALLCAGEAGAMDVVPAEGRRLRRDGVTITQAQIEAGEVSLREIRRRGRLIFSTPFSKQDGYGDGPIDPGDPISPGGRPTLQGNGTFLRVNGLDSQSCLECHAVLSYRVVPALFGVGGVGGVAAHVTFQPTYIDVTDAAEGFDGRFINPPFVFGSGEVQLLGLEMTEDLQALKAHAQANPGVDVPLLTKGVHFGWIRYQDGEFDTSAVEGIDEDLVVRPFGRKGEFATVREFALGALRFHQGMEPVELVGADVDADGDGVVNEVLVGEVSALEIFSTTLERPRREWRTRRVRRGERLFRGIGCADCHRPTLATRGRLLPYRYPEVPTDPDANVYYRVDLTPGASGFRRAPRGGIRVPLYADLKRHDMGPELAESFGSDLDRDFTTARLWGVADTAPYLHDGRALTLREAILLHGGEAEAARDAFAALHERQKRPLLEFLESLRTPPQTATDLD